MARAWAASTRCRTCAAAASTARRGTTPAGWQHKQNVFDDFIAAAEYLITEKLHLDAASWRSRAAATAACWSAPAMTQRPDLFGAALPAVGVMDMLRFHKFTIGWAWKSDYGSSETKEGFDTLIKYSPLQNLKPGTKYPATLVTTGDHDDRVVPAHSFKFAAALQAAQAGAGAGADPHRDQGRPRRRQADEQADRRARRRPRVHAARPRRRARGGAALEPVTEPAGPDATLASGPAVAAQPRPGDPLLARARASSASADRPARSRSCIARWSRSGAGSASAASCTRCPTAWCCPAPRRSSSPPTSAGCCIAPGAASSPAACSCCRRCSSSSRCRGSTSRSATLPAVAGAFAAVKPAVVAIIVQAAHRLGSRALKTPAAWAIAAPVVRGDGGGRAVPDHRRRRGAAGLRDRPAGAGAAAARPRRTAPAPRPPRRP